VPPGRLYLLYDSGSFRSGCPGRLLWLELWRLLPVGPIDVAHGWCSLAGYFKVMLGRDLMPARDWQLPKADSVATRIDLLLPCVRMLG
jgi:hypothetical protein